MTTAEFKLYSPNLISNLRAIYIIARKDWKIYWRYPLNAVSSVFQPLIWFLPVFFMAQTFSTNGQALGFAGYSGTTDYVSFVIVGGMLNQFILSVFWGMGYAMKNDMDAGVLESNWLTPMSRPLNLVGRTLANMLVTAVTAVGTLALLSLVFGFNISGNLGASLLIAVPMLLGLYGFGFAFAALVLLLREANTLVDMSSFMVQIFSGSQFPVNALPKFLMPIALALPLTYGLDAVRHLLLATRTLLPLPAEALILVVTMGLFIGLGLVVFRRMERHVRALGTLGQH